MTLASEFRNAVCLIWNFPRLASWPRVVRVWTGSGFEQELCSIKVLRCSHRSFKELSNSVKHANAL